MADKILNARIRLKYDTYANWTSKNPVLLSGEAAIAAIASGETQLVNNITAPQVLIKIGDGSSHYNDLPFVSGLAADVYNWAKAATKPSYNYGEIGGLETAVKGWVNETVQDTNTQYTVVPVDGSTYKFELMKKDIGESDFTSFDDKVFIDLTEVNSRLNTAEADIDHLEALHAAGNHNGKMTVAEEIATAVDNLDSTVSLPSEVGGSARTDGLSLTIVQENGVLTSVSGSIAANTYDAYGAASTVKNEVVGASGDASSASTIYGAKKYADGKVADEASARDSAILSAIDALDYSDGVNGDFVTGVTEDNGIVANTKSTFEAAFTDSKVNSVFGIDGEYNKSTNKLATVQTVTNAVADLNGAMHFIGKVEGDSLEDAIAAETGYTPKAGDVVLYGTKEYVYNGSTWLELGDESLVGSAIANLDSTISLPSEVGGSARTDGLSLTIVQENGVLTSVSGSIADGTYDAAGTAAGLIQGLNSTKFHPAGDDGLALNIVEENGKITGISGSIAAGTYDAAGTAAGLIQGLDSSVSLPSKVGGSARTDGLSLTIVQEDGVLKSVSGSIAAGTYDAAGAAALVLGESSDTKDDISVYGVKAYVDYVAADKASDAESASKDYVDGIIAGLDKKDSAVEHRFVTAVSEDDGIISVSRAQPTTDDIAQGALTLVWYCGSASDLV